MFCRRLTHQPLGDSTTDPLSGGAYLAALCCRLPHHSLLPIASPLFPDYPTRTAFLPHPRKTRLWTLRHTRIGPYVSTSIHFVTRLRKVMVYPGPASGFSFCGVKPSIAHTPIRSNLDPPASLSYLINFYSIVFFFSQIQLYNIILFFQL